MIQNIVVVSATFLQVITAKGKISAAGCYTVLIKGDDLNKSIRRNHRSVSSYDISLGIETECDVLQLSIHSDAEEFILLQHLAQTYRRTVFITYDRVFTSAATRTAFLL